MGQGRPAVPLAERFWSRVDKSEGCWMWTGTVRDNRYGAISRGGAENKRVPAHRLSWEINRGPIPEGLFIDHTCHNTLCVNPDHLRLVTQKQNMENRKGAHRHSSTGVRGVRFNAKSKRYRTEVAHNYKRYSAGNFDTLEEAEAAVKALRLKLFTHNDVDRRAA